MWWMSMRKTFAYQHGMMMQDIGMIMSKWEKCTRFRDTIVPVEVRIIGMTIPAVITRSIWVTISR